jgi:hypothetical protein
MRSEDPTSIDHPDLRDFAVQAAWVARLEAAVGVLEDLVVDLGDEEPSSESELKCGLHAINARIGKWQ